MTMRTTITMLAAAATISSNAQLTERCTQNSVNCGYYNVARWNDTLWLFTGTQHELIPYGAHASVVMMDPSGTIGSGGWFAHPGNQITFLLACTAHDDRPAVFGGWTQADCLTPEVHGLVGRLLPNGGLPLIRMLGTSAIQHVADPDTFIHAAYNDQVVVLGQSGDSITTITAPLGTINCMATCDTLDALGCANGATIITGMGGEVVSRAFVDGVQSILDYEGAGYGILSGQWLYRTGLDLVPLDSVLVEPVGSPMILRYDLSFLWVIGGDSARLYDPSLTPTAVLDMQSPDNYTLFDAQPSLYTIMTCGLMNDGPLVAEALRGVSELGYPNDRDVDVRLGNVDFTPITWDVIPGGFQVSGSASVYIVNEGTEPVDNAVLAYFSDFSGPCDSHHVLSEPGFPTLDQGDSALVFFSGIVDTVSSAAPFIDICLHVSSPARLMDRNTTNDEACASIDLFMAVEEFTGNSFSVYPNPCDRELVVSAAPSITANFTILDLSGRTVLSGSWSDEVIDVIPLREGSYVLWLDGHARGVRFCVAR